MCEIFGVISPKVDMRLKQLLTLILLLLVFAELIYALEKKSQEAELIGPIYYKEDEMIYSFTREKYGVSGDDSEKDNVKTILETQGIKPTSNPLAVKILVLGDSYVWGHGLANMNETWWMQLKKELRSRGYNDIDIIALGRCGWNTKQELAALKNIYPKYKPTLIIWSYCSNDSDEGIVSENYIVYLDRLAKLRQENLNEIQFNIQLRMLQKQYLNQNFFLDLVQSTENIMAYEQTLVKVAEYIQAIPAPLFFMPLATHDKNGAKWEEQTLFNPIKKLFDNHKIPFYVSPSLVNINKELWKANPVNGHSGPILTKLYAEQAADILEKDYSQYLGEKTSYNPQIKINDWTPGNLKVISNKQTEIVFIYPTSNMLSLPYNKEYVSLHLEEPIDLAAISIEGTSLTSAILYCTVISPEYHCDSRVVYSMGEKEGTRCTWNIEELHKEGKLNTVRIHAQFQDNATNRELKVHMNK